MSRSRGSNSSGVSFSQETIDEVWEKGKTVAGEDDAKKRKDTCGAWIEYSNYGKTVDGGTGWEIDHIKPVAKGGNDDLSNLQPLQWENNRGKSDSYPDWECATSAK